MFIYILFYPQFWIVNILLICLYKYIKFKKPDLKIHKLKILIYIFIVFISASLVMPIETLGFDIRYLYARNITYDKPFEKQKHYDYFTDKGIDFKNFNEKVIKSMVEYEYTYGFKNFTENSVLDISNAYDITFVCNMFTFDAKTNKYIMLMSIHDKDKYKNYDSYAQDDDNYPKLLAKYEIPCTNNKNKNSLFYITKDLDL